MSAQPIWSQWWKWSECSLFSVALLSVWNEVRIYFNTVALFLLWFILVGWEHDSVENIVLCQPQESFGDLNLNAVFRSFGGWSKMQVAITEKRVQTLFQVWNIACDSNLEGNKQKERDQMKIQSFNKASCDMYRAGEMFPNVYRQPQMVWMQQKEGTFWVSECLLDGYNSTIFYLI